MTAFRDNAESLMNSRSDSDSVIRDTRRSVDIGTVDETRCRLLR